MLERSAWQERGLRTTQQSVVTRDAHVPEGSRLISASCAIDGIRPGCRKGKSEGCSWLRSEQSESSALTFWMPYALCNTYDLARPHCRIVCFLRRTRNATP